MIILLVENVAEHEEANHGEEASDEVLKWPCTMSDSVTQTEAGSWGSSDYSDDLQNVLLHLKIRGI